MTKTRDMPQPFGTDYAGTYDALYREKDYGAECDVIERVFRKFSPKQVKTVLDVGCGTGQHAIELARRGFTVAGVDRSQAMIAQAREKVTADDLGDRPSLHVQDMRELALDRTFDAALMMFAVLGYATENDDVLATLRAVRKHLVDGGLFVFDCWYGPAVLHQRPGPRRRLVTRPDGTELLRSADTELNIREQVCTVHFSFRSAAEENSPPSFREDHRVRFFFPRELDLFLECSGFKLLKLAAFPSLHREPDETTWNVLGIARAQ